MPLPGSDLCFISWELLNTRVKFMCPPCSYTLHPITRRVAAYNNMGREKKLEFYRLISPGLFIASFVFGKNSSGA